MSDDDGKYEPMRFPAYTIDDHGVIREYLDADSWVICRGLHETAISKKNLPKDFKPAFSFNFFDDV